MQSSYSLGCSLRKYKVLTEASDREPHLWPFWVAVHAYLNDHKTHNAKVPFLMRWEKLSVFTRQSKIYKIAFVLGEDSDQAVGMLIKIEPWQDKTSKMIVRPAKTQISLGIRPVWSESSLCTQWVAKDTRFLHVNSEDSDQTGLMPRLIWVFAGRTVTLLVLSCRGSVISCTL